MKSTIVSTSITVYGSNFLHSRCVHGAPRQLKPTASSQISRALRWTRLYKSLIQEPRQKLAVTQSRGVRRENYPQRRRALRSWVSDSVNGEHCGCHCTLHARGKSNKCYLRGASALSFQCLIQNTWVKLEMAYCTVPMERTWGTCKRVHSQRKNVSTCAPMVLHFLIK